MKGGKEGKCTHIGLYVLQSISWKDTKEIGNTSFQGRELSTQRIGMGDFLLYTHLYIFKFEKCECIVSIQSSKKKI